MLDYNTVIWFFGWVSFPLISSGISIAISVHSLSCHFPLTRNIEERASLYCHQTAEEDIQILKITFMSSFKILFLKNLLWQSYCKGVLCKGHSSTNVQKTTAEDKDQPDSAVSAPLCISDTLSTLKKSLKHLLQRQNIQVMSKQWPSQLTDYHLLQRAFDQVLVSHVYLNEQ